MSEIAIAPIAIEHAAGLHACIDAVARKKRWLAQTSAKPRAQFDAFVSDSVAHDLVQFVALDGERVVGRGDIFAARADAVQHCGSLGMGVVGWCRRQGIGAQLPRACVAKAQRKGVTRIELEARADNAAVVSLYERAGFKQEAVKRTAMRFDGVYYDAVQMSLLSE
jgi:RimJ/RimL family protein N-acetyltransferase